MVQVVGSCLRRAIALDAMSPKSMREDYMSTFCRSSIDKHAFVCSPVYSMCRYTSHMTFELLYNENAEAIGEDPYAVRILYQEG